MVTDELRSLKGLSAADFRRLVPEEGEPLEVESEDALATWWQQKTSGTTYIRCQVPARALPGNSFSLRYSDLKIGPEGEVFMPRQRGAMIAQFVGNATRALLMAHQQEQGAKVLMEVDDNYLVPPPTFPGAHRDWGTSIDRSENDRYSFQAHRKIIRWVDGIIVATDELADRYAPKTQAPIYVCPNSADPSDWPEVTKPAGWVGTPRNVGFAGSASHRYDVTLIEPALDWAWRLGARIHKLGGASVQWSFPHEAMPWTDDLTEYRRNLQVLDVGLCPLKRGEWHDCKSDLKAIEYTMAGVVPIVSKAPPYKDWFDVVPTCENEKDWIKAVKWAVSAPAEELREVYDRARRFVLEHKLIEHNIGLWREAIR